jgi:uncharacterized cupredoxin-like copper-binding protein
MEATMKRFVFFALAALPLLLTACAVQEPVAQPKEITLEARDIAFGSPLVEVAVGQPIRLILKNAGALEHDFNIQTISVTRVKEESTTHGHSSGATVALHVAAVPGGTALLDFTPLEVGTFEFFCSTAGHKEAGMIGTLVVKDS